MGTDIRPEISRRSRYDISRHRYYELKHFCLQYPEWKAESFLAEPLSDGRVVRNATYARGQAAEATKPYTVEQMRYLAAHLNDISDPTRKAWLALSISLPLRPEEVLGLRWMDLDAGEGLLHIRGTVTHPTRNEPHFRPYTKTASSQRVLQLPPEILSYLPERGEPDEFIIGGKEPVSYTRLRSMRKWITKETGFGETITPRRFRTTVATDISAMTHDLKLVQRMLGHANPQTTLKYYDKGRKEAADASEAIRRCYGFTEN